MSIITEIYEDNLTLATKAAEEAARLDALEAERELARQEGIARGERLRDPQLIAYNDSIRNHPNVAAAREAFGESVKAFDRSLPLSLVKEAIDRGLLADDIENPMSASYEGGSQSRIDLGDGITIIFGDVVDRDVRGHRRKPIVEISKHVEAGSPEIEQVDLGSLMPVWEEPVPTATLPPVWLFRKHRTRREYIVNLETTARRNNELAAFWEKVAGTLIGDYTSGKDSNEHLAEILLVCGDSTELEKAIRCHFNSVIEQSKPLRDIDSRVRDASRAAWRETDRWMSYREERALREKLMAEDLSIISIRRKMQDRIRRCRNLIQDTPLPVTGVQDTVI